MDYSDNPTRAVVFSASMRACFHCHAEQREASYNRSFADVVFRVNPLVLCEIFHFVRDDKRKERYSLCI
jgi:hypothetical protein